jgi:Protein of unknown function (DUF2934)
MVGGPVRIGPFLLEDICCQRHSVGARMPPFVPVSPQNVIRHNPQSPVPKTGLLFLRIYCNQHPPVGRFLWHDPPSPPKFDKVQCRARLRPWPSYAEHLIAHFYINDEHYCGGMLPRAEVHLPRSGPVPSLGRFRHYIEFETRGEKEEDMAGWAEDFSPKSAPQIAGDNPTHEEIGLRAHEIFIERGGAHGHDMEDWLEAERQLLDERAKTRLKANAAVV